MVYGAIDLHLRYGFRRQPRIHTTTFMETESDVSLEGPTSFAPMV